MSTTAHVDARRAEPPLGAMAELVHRIATDATGPEIIGVEIGHADLSIARWRVPPAADHPGDVLLGLVVPPTWTAIGLITTGLARPMRATGGVDADAGRARPVRLAVLADRHGEVASVIDRAGAEPEVLASPPSGWVADLMARSLGRPTPPPDRIARWVDLLWLDAIASEVFAAPSPRRSWADLARLHPLQPSGAALDPTLLAIETETAEVQTSWERIRRRYRGAVPAQDHLPPGAERMALGRWFDDGSFCRWTQRDLPPAEVIWPAVCEALPSALGPKVADALLTI